MRHLAAAQHKAWQEQPCLLLLSHLLMVRPRQERHAPKCTCLVDITPASLPCGEGKLLITFLLCFNFLRSCKSVMRHEHHKLKALHDNPA